MGFGPYTEEILEVPCPRCHAAPHSFCNRRRDKLTPEGSRNRTAGKPPSHQERMWARQGHGPADFAGLRAKIKPGKFKQPKERAVVPPKDAIYPIRYRASRICPKCKSLREVEVCVVDFWTVGYRCNCGHKWLYTAPKEEDMSKNRPQPRRWGGGLTSEQIADYAWASIACPQCKAAPKSACVPLPEPPRTVCKERFVAAAMELKNARKSERPSRESAEASAQLDLATERGCFMREISDADVAERLRQIGNG